MSKTGKARFTKAAKRLERLVGAKDRLTEEERDRAAGALWELLMAAVQTCLERTGGKVFSERWGQGVVADGRAYVFIFASALGAYDRAGFPLPPGSAEGGQLAVFGLFVEDEAVVNAPRLARAMNVFADVFVVGVSREGKLVKVDAVGYVRHLVKEMTDAKGAVRFAKKRGVTDLQHLRSLQQLWRDYCEGRVVL
ncbi:hypothetical protein EDD75_2232 [Thermodesulfitimonas autotrophica]|uniref:Uncharacterized protein n=1 Tax=Thermodesulfitimonas autotrophica TaxID=1894989 RepID=A0A3N5BD98_9THEO|nr:hypothetical protein [Thermodesulfitimonas autotrophica]RPF42011.1 hypothetical protein EDD75_2232 [Thermodesulfitimonas autotrophica]